MKREALGLCLAICAVIAFVGCTEKERRRYREVTRTVQMRDRGQPGRGPGDILSYVSDLFDEAGVPAGTKEGGCRTIGRRGDDFLADCSETITLADGEIYTWGVINQSALERFDVQRLRILGGVGVFEDASGEESIRQTELPDKFEIELVSSRVTVGGGGPRDAVAR